MEVKLKSCQRIRVVIIKFYRIPKTSNLFISCVPDIILMKFSFDHYLLHLSEDKT